MTKIERKAFTQQHQNKAVDLDKVRNDADAKAKLEQAGVSMEKLAKADANRDGAVDAQEAWRVADDFDSDGTRKSLIDVNSWNQPTQGAKAAGALGALLQSEELQAPPPVKAQREDFQAAHGRDAIALDKVADDSEVVEELAEAGISMDKLRRADTNRDGAIDAKEAWKVADDFDHDGTRASLDSIDRQGRQTEAGKAAGTLGILMQNRKLLATPTPNDKILFVGMNKETRESAGAMHEIRNLRNSGADVEAIMDSTVGNDMLRVNGRTYDLTTEDGRKGFVGTFNLPADQSAKIEETIAAAGEDAKDEVGQIAQVWARAERGGTIPARMMIVPSRMVISGHHVGSAVWGDDNGELSWNVLHKLSDAMPRAASQVEDLHIAACYSGGAHKEQEYQKIFPNLKTIWAYSGSAPGAGSGATVHESTWERATRGRATRVADAARRLKDRGIRKAENILARAAGDAMQVEGRTLQQLQQDFGQQRPVFEPYFTGERDVQSSQRGELREMYNALQRMLEHPELPPDDRREAEQLRDQTIRLLYYKSNVRGKFADKYQDSIQNGYAALNMTAPDYGSMSRAEAMGAISTFREKLEATEEKPHQATGLLYTLNGLWNLDSRTIPSNWI